MSNKIGRFEIASEITHSDFGSVCKASDPESGQTVALKVVKLEPLGEQAAQLVKTVLEEAQASKVLNSHNIALLNSAEEVEGMLCASMEYVQGNSVATMLARKEGFSIWDLQDIARQTCQGLDHAHAKNIVHSSLEPAKILVAWDGTVKALSFGISAMSAFAPPASGKAPEVLHYMSPEQLRGDPLDARSNLFSLGAILYEMVTERKAFDGEDADQVRQAILEMTPVAADQVNRKIHPALSEVIMKALAKAPEERYQSGQDLVNDLERCKESATKAAAPKTNPLPQKAPAPQKAATAAPAAAQTVKQTPAAAVPAAAKPAATKPEQKPIFKPAVPAATKAAAAGAGGSGGHVSASAGGPGAAGLETPELMDFSAQTSATAISTEAGLMSSADTAEPEVEAPRIAVDPMMDESRQAGGGQSRSFSEIDELPPLKEVFIAPAPPPAAEPEPPSAVHRAVFKNSAPEKPKVQPREVAKKAVTEIKKTPPQLFLYSIAGAVAIMLLIIGGIAYHIYSGNSDDDVTPAQPAVAANAPEQTNATPTQSAAQAPATTQTPPPAEVAPEPETQEAPAVSVQPKYNNKNKKKTKAAPRAPAIVLGVLSISSNPAGAQVQVDGQSSSGGTTPFDLRNLVPGQHTVTVSKPGYAAETRTIDVASGSKSFMSVQLTPLTATVSANSDPTGAEVWMDGRDTGRATPTQITVDKPGNHSFAFKKQGYLDETTTANLQIGQTTHLAPSLRALGNTDDIKYGGKFKKVFGGGETAGMGSVSVKTQPKGAQIAVNNRIIDKLSPAEFYLNPGNYVIDITQSGFKNIHKVVTVEKSGKVVIDESMDRE